MEILITCNIQSITHSSSIIFNVWYFIILKFGIDDHNRGYTRDISTNTRYHLCTI